MPRETLSRLFAQRRAATKPTAPQEGHGKVKTGVAGREASCTCPIKAGLEGLDIHPHWKQLLQQQLKEARPRDARKCLAKLRQLTKSRDALQETGRLVTQLRVEPQISAEAMIDELLAAGSEHAATPEAVSSDVKTFASRFDRVSQDIACPHGCAGPTRYGYRVGDLSKYVAMEREDQTNAILVYCPICHVTFDAEI
mmetsp:Transcript_37738/g.70380  ORF Transcript_37738/g.70380 Transcript_37738/m.70380 type:complete len:197 (-) Transcript_37738:140-730(-)